MIFKLNQRGFTLLEVMVALMIVGMALPAVVMQVQSSLDFATRSEERTFAFWIAENVNYEIVLNHKIKKKLPAKKKADTVKYADREWHTKVESKKVGEGPSAMQRYEVFVGLEKDEWMANMVGYLPL